MQCYPIVLKHVVLMGHPGAIFGIRGGYGLLQTACNGLLQLLRNFVHSHQSVFRCSFLLGCCRKALNESRGRPAAIAILALGYVIVLKLPVQLLVWWFAPKHHSNVRTICRESRADNKPGVNRGLQWHVYDTRPRLW